MHKERKKNQNGICKTKYATRNHTYTPVCHDNFLTLLNHQIVCVRICLTHLYIANENENERKFDKNFIPIKYIRLINWIQKERKTSRNYTKQKSWAKRMRSRHRLESFRFVPVCEWKRRRRVQLSECIHSNWFPNLFFRFFFFQN